MNLTIQNIVANPEKFKVRPTNFNTKSVLEKVCDITTVCSKSWKNIDVSLVVSKPYAEPFLNPSGVQN